MRINPLLHAWLAKKRNRTNCQPCKCEKIKQICRLLFFESGAWDFIAHPSGAWLDWSPGDFDESWLGTFFSGFPRNSASSVSSSYLARSCLHLSISWLDPGDQAGFWYFLIASTQLKTSRKYQLNLEERVSSWKWSQCSSLFFGNLTHLMFFLCLFLNANILSLVPVVWSPNKKTLSTVRE